MSRCPRCDACESMWDTQPCPHCGYPNEEKRDAKTIEQDEKDYPARVNGD